MRDEQKKSPQIIVKKQELGLSKFLQLETELGFKPRSSSVISEAPKILKKPKETDPKIRNYMREKKKKSIDNKTNTLIEHISKETKRVAGLKILDVKNQENLQKLKKKEKNQTIIEKQAKK
jgi:hypothetical protein